MSQFGERGHLLVKMEKSFIFQNVIPFVLLLFVAGGDARRQNGVCAQAFYRNSSCPITTSFLCLNGKCIRRGLFCDGSNDCEDNSDERSCNSPSSCPDKTLMRCLGTRKCIPLEWKCDGIPDCYLGKDEETCGKKIDSARDANRFALRWLYNQTNAKPATEMWGSQVYKSAVALYFTDFTFSAGRNGTRKEIAYELSIQLLSLLSRRKLRDIPSSDLASYVNAFLVSCLDPRKFHGMNIVQELRSRVDSENYTNPYVLLSLCNAGDTITQLDKLKLIDAFWNKKRMFWTETQAVILMALACASKQPGSDVDAEALRELAMELKLRQYRNGTVENLQTTALVLQALFSAEPDEDPDNFDEKKALEQMLLRQKADGSFGNILNTYYVLPVLNCMSLVNISADHCESVHKDENSALEDLKNRSGPKIRVEYSLWIGNERYLERNMVLRVPSNMSLYGIMEIAAEIDSKYSFEYVVKNRKPYITAISGLQDDPEKGKFWFLYAVEAGKPSPSGDSPAEVIPKDNDHFVMWYRRGSWID